MHPSFITLKPRGKMSLGFISSALEQEREREEWERWRPVSVFIVGWMGVVFLMLKISIHNMLSKIEPRPYELSLPSLRTHSLELILQPPFFLSFCSFCFYQSKWKESRAYFFLSISNLGIGKRGKEISVAVIGGRPPTATKSTRRKQHRLHLKAGEKNKSWVKKDHWNENSSPFLWE